MKHVRYVGDNPTLHKGATALMRDDGKVQLDGPNEGWGAPERMDPRCFGWHAQVRMLSNDAASEAWNTRKGTTK